MSPQREQTILVRMYNVGFGDSFLIALPGNRTILVDCGFHSQGKGAFGGRELARRIIDDLVELVGRPRIDVVIATHRHQDHVYAFNASEWDSVEVGEVWLPWVEDPDNKDARKLWKKHKALTEDLALALDSFGLADNDRQAVSFMLWNAGVGDVSSDPAFAAWSNAAALDRLHSGFARRDSSKPRFLPETMEMPEVFETKILPGVRIHVLGPPRDPDLIAEVDPKGDGETYRALAHLGGQSLGAKTLAPPFADTWRVSDDYADVLGPDEIERLRGLARSADPLFAAQALDTMVNSTSLVLVLQVGKARLLLAGDAEWGTWKTILANSKARALLQGTTFLKVGHHGSHNATPKTLVEKILRKGVRAMISTQAGKGTYRNNIPLGDLLSAFQAQGVEVLRSDDLPATLPAGVTSGPDNTWVDLTLKC